MNRRRAALQTIRKPAPSYSVEQRSDPAITDFVGRLDQDTVERWQAHTG